MYFKDFFSALYVGVVNGNLAVETTGTEKRFIKNIGAVGGGNDDNALIYAETVHFNEQLVKGLLSFIVASAETRASLTADGVDFVNENNRRSIFLCLVEQIADTRRTDTDKHFNKVGARN